jgi:hypothetical protein
MKLLPGLEAGNYGLASDLGYGAGWSDPWRLTIDVSGLGVTGFQFESQLQEQSYIFPELATHKVPPTPRVSHHVPLLFNIAGTRYPFFALLLLPSTLNGLLVDEGQGRYY